MRYTVVLLTLCFLTVLPAFAEVTVIEEGKTVVTIVVPDQFAKSVLLPASRLTHVARLRQHYSAEVLGSLEGLLSEAAAVQGDDPGINARIAMATGAVRYARLVTDLLEVAHEKDSNIVKERLCAVEAHLRDKVLTHELAPLHSHRYLRMALSYAEREVE